MSCRVMPVLPPLLVVVSPPVFLSFLLPFFLSLFFPPLPPLPFALYTQAAQLACLEPLVPGLLSMLEGVPSRLKLLLTRYATPVTAD